MALIKSKADLAGVGVRITCLEKKIDVKNDKIVLKHLFLYILPKTITKKYRNKKIKSNTEMRCTRNEHAKLKRGLERKFCFTSDWKRWTVQLFGLNKDFQDMQCFFFMNTMLVTWGISLNFSFMLFSSSYHLLERCSRGKGIFPLKFMKTINCHKPKIPNGIKIIFPLPHSENHMLIGTPVSASRQNICFQQWGWFFQNKIIKI